MTIKEVTASVGRGLYGLASCVLPVRPQLGGSRIRGYVVQVGKVGLLATIALIALFALQNFEMLMARWRPNATFFEVFDLKTHLNKTLVVTGVLAAAQGLTLVAMIGDDLYRHMFAAQKSES